jgi:hypothetical protein
MHQPLRPGGKADQQGYGRERLTRGWRGRGSKVYCPTGIGGRGASATGNGLSVRKRLVIADTS